MGYINIYVSNDAYLYVKNSQLFLNNKENKSDYPLEDINSIMIENLNTTISTYTLSKCSEFGILVFICNQNHLPCGVVLPFCEHYQTLSVYNLQINLSKPLQKQMWRSIIRNKIENQNAVLNIFGKIDLLKKLSSEVLSGDLGNNEAKASLIYFKELFGKNFKRRDEIFINTCLNYGYSILRGFIARSIAAHGLTPYIAIFHSNQYNAFNLADDLIEVFRPIVDLFVKAKLEDEVEFSSKVKASLLSIINIDMLIDGQKQTLSNAIEILVESYVKSLKENKNLIKSVYICGLNEHKYE